MFTTFIEQGLVVNMDRKKQNILLSFVAIIMIGVSLVAINNELVTGSISKTVAQKSLTDATDVTVIQQNIETAKATYDYDTVTAIDPLTILKESYDTSAYPAVGQVVVPSVGIHLTVYKGLANEHLLFGAGTSSPNQSMGSGNYGLVSHRSAQADLLFTPLDNVVIDDVVYITDLTNIYEYTVDTNIIVEPNQVQYLSDDFRQNDGAIITLLTCSDADGLRRRIVQGTLTNTYEMDENKKITNYFIHEPT